MTFHSIQREALVPYTPDQMYELVNQVEAYPEFVPWCTQGHIIKLTEDEMVARLKFSGKGLHKILTTRNELNRNRSITLTLVEGPFKHLKGLWAFEGLAGGEGCKVTLDLEFEFTHALLNHLFVRLFSDVANRLVDVFCNRADTIYGRK